MKKVIRVVVVTMLIIAMAAIPVSASGTDTTYCAKCTQVTAQNFSCQSPFNGNKYTYTSFKFWKNNIKGTIFHKHKYSTQHAQYNSKYHKVFKHCSKCGHKTFGKREKHTFIKIKKYNGSRYARGARYKLVSRCTKCGYEKVIGNGRNP